MKKTLLFCLAVTASAATLMADTKTPTLYPDASFQRISNDGRYIVSDVMGTVKIFDLVSGSVEEFYEDYENGNSYSIGLGNCFTADGSILLGNSLAAETDASYLKDGKWHSLAVPDENMSNYANGITPDGSRICGSVGAHEISLEDATTMLLPAYWDRNADGSYGEYHMLPHPTKDLFGEVPQYITAIAISIDGKTIVGQMTFSSGMMVIPVVYTQNNEGEWSYSLPTKDLFNPDELEPVENPGDGPEWPNYESYMTEDEMNAYNNALAEWYQTWEGDYPSFEDFMSEEEKEAYQTAMDNFNTLNQAWEEKFYAFLDYQQAVIEASPNFLFNNVLLSVDNKQIVGTLESEDPNADPFGWGRPARLYTPCTVDLATSELNKFDIGTSALASGVAENGVIFAHNGQNSVPMIGYIIQDGNSQTIDSYISSKNASYGEWIKKNMTHEVIVDYDWENDEDIVEEFTFTGMPIATPDLGVIAVWNNCPWDGTLYAEGAIFDMTVTSGIAVIGGEQKDLTIDENGALNIPAGFVSVNVYNLAGACVKTIDVTAGSVDLNLGNGVYIVKGARNDGSSSVIKMTK